MLKTQTSHIEIIWGTPILDEGFTSIPNLLIRHAAKLMTPKEFQFICVLTTFKHDSRDPYPSQETIGRYLGIGERAVRKLVDSLEQKRLLKVGYRYIDGKRKSAVYSIKPLIDCVLEIAGEARLPDEKPIEKIFWKTDEENITTGTKRSGTTGTKRSGTTGTKRSGTTGTKRSGENNQLKEKKKIIIENNQPTRKNVEDSDLPLKIKKVLLQNLKRLVDDQISIFDISIIYDANKETFNEFEFANILNHVLVDTTGKIRNIKARLNKGMQTYKRIRIKENEDISATRKELLPNWFTKEGNNTKDNIKEDDTFEEERKQFKEGFKGKKTCEN
jgi:hypothetical protein